MSAAYPAHLKANERTCGNPDRTIEAIPYPFQKYIVLQSLMFRIFITAAAAEREGGFCGFWTFVQFTGYQLMMGRLYCHKFGMHRDTGVQDMGK